MAGSNANTSKSAKGNKPSIPQGTRDFGPDVVRKRQFIFSIIREVFELYGFQPLETPAMENLETLMGKYGEEGDKLIFKILNNGLDNPQKEKQTREAFEKILSGKSSRDLTERALKYDLTIPFARFVAMNHTQLVFPFKRYQIQPVWRADRPQKGRYREFLQCDADIVGSNSLLNEIELVHIYNEVFSRLGITGFEIKINSRKILLALSEMCGGMDKMMDITIAIDKLDKIGIDKVKEELVMRKLNDQQVKTIENYLNITGTNKEIIMQASRMFAHSEKGREGIAELEFIINTFGTDQHLTDNSLFIDLTLARGLNYYTGTIFEVKAPSHINMGSIGGGGRYDDLTGLFGVPGIPGIGISFGVDRIYDVLEEMELFPKDIDQNIRALFANLGKDESLVAYGYLKELRKKGIPAEIYPDMVKLDKQFKYADKKNIPFTVLIGSREIEQQTCIVKDLRTGEQMSVPFENLTSFLFI